MGNGSNNDCQHPAGQGRSNTLEPPLVCRQNDRLRRCNFLGFFWGHLVLGYVVAVPGVPFEVGNVEADRHPKQYIRVLSDNVRRGVWHGKISDVPDAYSDVVAFRWNTGELHLDLR